LISSILFCTRRDGGCNGGDGDWRFLFQAKDPEALRNWYVEHLGVGSVPYGAWETQAGTSIFSPFPADTDYFPADKPWMLNLRVDDLDGLMASLKAAGIEVTTNPDWDMPGVGRFARIHDPEGNPIELWQPE
jgi:predicted enzyme related to lactoylglutathione lyase